MRTSIPEVEKFPKENEIDYVRHISYKPSFIISMVSYKYFIKYINLLMFFKLEIQMLHWSILNVV